MADEKQYLETFLTPVRKCKNYKPKFGQGSSGEGLSLNQFEHLYGSDPFYAWIGFDTDLMYAAHCAAGGIASVYRQVGVGCKHLFRAVLVDTTGYTDPEFATWSYSTQTRSGKSKKLSLDGRLELSKIKNQTVLANVQLWITDYCADLDEVEEPRKGIVFKVRQGYKSKESKRRNADIDNATVAWANSYLPVFAVFSSQIDADAVLRYRNNRSGILIGTMDDNSQASLYAFCDQVLGYDLMGFFKRYADGIKTEIHDVLELLLSAE